MSAREELIVFSHIPKTAGTSLLGVIGRNYRSDEIELLYGADGEPKAMAIASGAEKLGEIRCLCSHQSPQMLPRVQRPHRVFSVLRQPVERCISLYYHVLAKDQPGALGNLLADRIRAHKWSLEDIYRNLEGQDPREQGFEAFFDAQAYGTAAVVGVETSLRPKISLTRKLVWRATPLRWPLPREPLPPGDAADLVDRILEQWTERGHVLGLTEELDRSVSRFGQAFGWSDISVTRERVGTRPRGKEISDELRRMIEANNPLDLLLWQRVRDSFGSHVDSD